MRGDSQRERYIPERRHQTRAACKIISVPGCGPVHILHAETSAMERGRSRWRRRHQHDVFHIVLVTEGSGSYLMPDEVMRVNAPHLFLVSPGQAHCFTTEPNDDSSYAELTFALPEAPRRLDWSELMSLWCGEDCVVPLGQATDPICASRLKEAIEGCVRHGHHPHPHMATILQAALAEILLILYRHLVADRVQRPPDDPVALARAHIEEHASGALSLTEVAHATGLSAKHLSRLFRQRYDIAPMQYRRQVLMQRAAVLLTTTAYPIKAIAGQLGFDDVHYFNRCFSQLHGTPPGRYRKASQS